MEYSSAITSSSKLLGYELTGLGIVLSSMTGGKIGQELLVAGPILLASAYGVDLVKKYYQLQKKR